MRRPVRIVSRPKAQSGLDIRMNPGMGFNANQLSWPVMAGEFSQKDIETRGTIQPTDWDNANLEAEKGETVVTDLNHDGIPEHYKIGGKRHYEGGTPLNLPENSFIFSRDKSMKIKDEDIQKMFGKSPKRSGYTPADLAKTYDINKYRKVLADPDSDDLARDTAEMMITNYNLKLGKLALAQESLKGFPQGIPAISMPYLENMGMNPAEFLQTQGQEEQPAPDNMAKYGKEVLPKAQYGLFNRRAKPAGMRYNPQSGQYEVINRRGEVIGIANPPQGYPGAGSATTTTTTGPSTTTTTGTSTTTTVKKQNIPDGATVIKRSDYKTEEEYVKARDDAFKKRGNATVYTQGSDGKYYKVGEKDAGVTFDQNLTMINSTFSDPAVQQELYNRTLAAAQKKDNQGANMGFTVDELKKMTPADLAGQFIEMQDRNLKTAKLFAEKGISYDCFDNSTGKRKTGKECEKVPYASLDEAFVAAGAKPPADKKAKGLQQATYIGYRDLIEDNVGGKIKDQALSDKLRPYNVAIQGVADETGPSAKKNVSKIDTAYTNTTSGQLAQVKSDKQIAEELVDETETTTEKKEAKHLQEQQRAPANAPWWLQDIIKVAGAAGDFARVKKYMPWQATPQTFLPEGVFYDPNRELAANAESANIMAQNLAAFQGPQALSARTSQIQGQAAKNAADILGRYNNMNVGVANTLETQRAAMLNQAAQQRAALATNLYDKNTIANQQFDNAKNLARQNLRQGYIDALTNKWNTFNLNQLYPQYQVHPEVGGGIFFEDGRPITPDASGKDAAFEKFKSYKHLLPGTDDATVWNIVKSDMGQTGADASSVDPNYLKMLQANMAGLGQ